jgi:hypothetical protein
MQGTVAALKDHPASDARSGGGDAKVSSKVDPKELRRILRTVKKISRSDGAALWQPVAPGGPSRYDYYQEALMIAFRDQLPSSIRRLKASKPIAVRTRKIVSAMLTLGRFSGETAEA